MPAGRPHLLLLLPAYLLLLALAESLAWRTAAALPFLGPVLFAAILLLLLAHAALCRGQPFGLVPLVLAAGPAARLLLLAGPTSAAGLLALGLPGVAAAGLALRAAGLWPGADGPAAPRRGGPRRAWESWRTAAARAGAHCLDRGRAAARALWSWLVRSWRPLAGRFPAAALAAGVRRCWAALDTAWRQPPLRRAWGIPALGVPLVAALFVLLGMPAAMQGYGRLAGAVPGQLAAALAAPAAAPLRAAAVQAPAAAPVEWGSSSRPRPLLPVTSRHPQRFLPEGSREEAVEYAWPADGDHDVSLAEALAAPTPTPAPQSVSYSPQCPSLGLSNPYPRGVCTWYAKAQRPDLPGFWGDYGLALNWPYAAEACGFRVDHVPAAGAVIVFPPGANGAYWGGHVGYVEEVGVGYLLISECNVDHSSAGIEAPRWWEAGYACAFRRIPSERLDPRVWYIH